MCMTHSRMEKAAPLAGRAFHAPESGNEIRWRQSQRLEMDKPSLFLPRGEATSTGSLWGKSLAWPSSWPSGKMPEVSTVTLTALLDPQEVLDSPMKVDAGGGIPPGTSLSEQHCSVLLYGTELLDRLGQRRQQQVSNRWMHKPRPLGGRRTRPPTLSELPEWGPTAEGEPHVYKKAAQPVSLVGLGNSS